MKAYTQSIQEVLTSSSTTPQGLSAGEAAGRLAQYGENKLAEGRRKSWLQRIWEQLRDPMILVLIAAAVISGAFGEIADMAIILVVVVLNAALGIYQENKAEQAIEALRAMSAPHSTVRRDGHLAVIPSHELVPGDIVLLEAGNAVPADLRLITAASLKIEEAALTGESVPVEKSTEPLEGEEVPLGDRVNMAYMGTNVTYGRGEGVVVATGMRTEMGRIADILTHTEEEKTPLQQKLASLSKILSAAVLAICAFIFLFNVLQGGALFDSFLTAVSLAVAAIPEGLVVVVTVLLSIGVTRMSERGAIIRRLTAVESLGCTEVICSDKTGTLTQNRMTAVDSWGDRQMLGTAMYLCNDVERNADGSLQGDPTQVAQKAFGLEVGGIPDLPRVGEIPFDSNRKMMTTLHTEGTGILQCTTGAPDAILARCDAILLDGRVQPLDEATRQQVAQQNKRMADRALRVLGGAIRRHDTLPAADPAIEEGMTFVGLIGMIDPIRPEVKAAIEQCRTAGVRAVMITGDHRDTAAAIARDLGILTDPSQAITGAELSAMSDEEFERRIDSIVVYARVQPEHKVRIVNMWRKKGRITAMTGDGVNDAPALKSADIGVGMGITGTDVTKNVADMVLSDDNFATIVYAVEEGRRIYDNIRKAIQFLLASNLSEVISIFLATLAGLKLFAPIHILWINLITDTFPAMALGMERAEADSMNRPPRPSNESIFAGGLGIDVLFQGTAIALLTLASFFIGHAQSQVTGMTMAFMTLSLCEVFHALSMRSRTHPFWTVKGHNRTLIGAILLSFVLTLGVIYLPGLNTLFQLTPLPVADLLLAMLLALAILPVVEIGKAIHRRSRTH